MSTRVKHIIKKLWSLPPKDREVWLEAIMGEFDEDFSHAKWREGYEQGKFEGAWVGEQLKDADKIRQELNKPVVTQFVADWYEEHKGDLEYNIWKYLYDWHNQKDDDFKKWMNSSSNKTFQTLVNMHQFGYEVEKEKRYTVKITKTDQYLYSRDNDFFFVTYVRPDDNPHNCHTRKELENGMFGWVFDCPGIQIEEVE
jgi:hypothetical protein